MLASLFVTLAISLKVGAALMLPSFLGVVQYQYGTQNLLAVIIIIISVQIFLATPFVSPTGSKLMGF